jgi:hypothetical protein
MSALIRNRILAAALLVAAVGRAQPTELLVVLDFASQPPCPDQTLFMRQVEARVGPAIRWESGGVTLRVQVAQQAEEFSGQLQHTRADGVSTERVLTGQKCEDVVSGLALVAALALDPNASTAPAAELESASVGIESAAVAPVAKPPPAPAAAPPLPPTAAPEAVPPRETTAARSPLPFSLGVLGVISADAGPAPVTLIALGGRLEAEFRPSGSFMPSVALGAQYARSGLLGRESSLAEFEWVVVRTALCPVALEPFERARLRACALVDLGSMTAQGRGEAIEVPERTNQFWFATGPGLTFVYRPFSPLVLELGGGALAAITRPDYLFDTPRTVVYEVPLVAWTAQLGVGLSFFDQ